MRFISGKFGSRKLIIPKHLPIRPTTDIAKEAVFNTLNNLVNFQELSVLDLFSGSGSLGLECISRGAGTTTFIEKNRKCIQHLKQINKLLKTEAKKLSIMASDI